MLILQPLLSELEQAVTAGSEVVDEASGKKIGTVNTALGSRGMGLLRLEEALKPGSALRIGDNRDVRVHAIKPDWWPAEWTQVGRCFSNRAQLLESRTVYTGPKTLPAVSRWRGAGTGSTHS